jgi:hypothetical protein
LNAAGAASCLNEDRILANSLASNQGYGKRFGDLVAPALFAACGLAKPQAVVTPTGN